MDRRLLNITLNQFFSPEILKPNCVFSNSDIYYMPEEGEFEDYLEYIHALPINDALEIFGLHGNSDIIIAS